MNHYYYREYMQKLSPEDRERHVRIIRALAIRESQKKSQGESIPINYYRLNGEHGTFNMLQEETDSQSKMKGQPVSPIRRSMNLGEVGFVAGFRRSRENRRSREKIDMPQEPC